MRNASRYGGVSAGILLLIASFSEASRDLLWHPSWIGAGW